MVRQAEWKLSEADFRTVSDLIYKHCGITLHDGKRDLVQARLARQMRDGDFNSIEEYIKDVLADASGAKFTSLVDAISTNLTSFFREAEHFRYVTSVVVPALIEKRRQECSRRILAWSAACSSGEEPYSLAITLAEALANAAAGAGRARPPVDGPTGPAGWDLRILATDISTRVLATAQAGMYPAARISAVPQDCRQLYFGRCDPSFAGGPGRRPRSAEEIFQVRPFLRNLVRFRHLNLIEPWPFKGPFDIIFCRNVMIYFDKPTQERLVNRFWECLDSGGLLFTGHSESLTGIAHKFRYMQPSIYRKA